MAQIIQFKRSGVADAVPTTSDLVLGELAVNYYDGVVFLKQDNGSESIVELDVAQIANVEQLSDLDDINLSSLSSGNILRYDGTDWVSVSKDTVITNVFTVADQSAQLALAANEGDLVIRTDLKVTYIHTGGSAGDMTDYDNVEWGVEVATVNGHTGVVVLDPDDLSDSATLHKWLTAAQIAKIDYLSVTSAINLHDVLYDNTTLDFGEYSLAYLDTHYLTGFNNSNYITLGGSVAGALDRSGSWSVGIFLSAPMTTDSDENTFVARNGSALTLEIESSSWWAYHHNTSSQGTYASVSEPSQTSTACLMVTCDGSTIRWFYNGQQIATATASGTLLPVTAAGDLVFGKSILGASEPWDNTMSSIFVSDQALPGNISLHSSQNAGDISEHANFSDINAWIQVGDGTVVDRMGNYTPSVVGSLTFTAK